MRRNRYHILGALALIAAVAILHSLAGCDTSVAPDWGIIVSGTVTDSVYGYAIDSAQIDYFNKYPLDTFRLPLVYTDSHGKYRFDTDGTGPYYMTVRKTGYKSRVLTFSSPTRKATK